MKNIQLEIHFPKYVSDATLLKLSFQKTFYLCTVQTGCQPIFKLKWYQNKINSFTQQALSSQGHKTHL